VLNWEKRATYYLNNQNVNKALSDLSKAIQIEPENAFFYVTLSDIYLSMNDARRSMTALLKANELDSDNMEALKKLAELNLIFKNYEKVFEYLNKALGLDKFNPVVYFMRGYAFAELGDTANAIHNMQIAMEQNPDYYDACFNLGLLHGAQNSDLALDYYDNALRINPSSIETLYAKGIYQQNHLLINEAIESYNKIIEINPDFIYSYYNLGYINLVYLEEFEMAADYFSQVIERDEKNIDAYLNRGYAFELDGKNIYARNDYQRATDLDPNHLKAIKAMNRLDTKVNN